MTKIYISEFSRMALDAGLATPPAAQMPAQVHQTPITVSGSSQQSAAFAAGTSFVRLHAQVACHVVVGTNPTATTNSMRLAEGQTEYFGVTPGHKLAVIQG